MKTSSSPLLQSLKKRSRWARQHPVQARWVITFCHVGLVGLSLWLGILLHLSGLSVGEWLLPMFSLVFVAASLFYPGRNRPRYSYARQKTHDLILLLSTTWMIALAFHSFLSKGDTMNSAVEPTAVLVALRIPESGSTSLHEKIQQKVAAFHTSLLHTLHHWKGKEQARKRSFGLIMLRVLLLLLTIVLLCYLYFLILVYACRARCAGMVGWGLLLLLFGFVALYFLGMLLGRWVNRIGG